MELGPLAISNGFVRCVPDNHPEVREWYEWSFVYRVYPTVDYHSLFICLLWKALEAHVPILNRMLSYPHWGTACMGACRRGSIPLLSFTPKSYIPPIKTGNLWPIYKVSKMYIPLRKFLLYLKYTLWMKWTFKKFKWISLYEINTYYGCLDGVGVRNGHLK